MWIVGISKSKSGGKKRIIYSNSFLLDKVL